MLGNTKHMPRAGFKPGSKQRLEIGRMSYLDGSATMAGGYLFIHLHLSTNILQIEHIFIPGPVKESFWRGF